MGSILKRNSDREIKRESKLNKEAAERAELKSEIQDVLDKLGDYQVNVFTDSYDQLSVVIYQSDKIKAYGLTGSNLTYSNLEYNIKLAVKQLETFDRYEDELENTRRTDEN